MILADDRRLQYPNHDVPKESALEGDEGDNYERLLQKYQKIKEQLAELQMQEKNVEDQVKDTSCSTQEKTENQKPASSKPQTVNKYTPRKPEKKIVVDITGDVAKEKVRLRIIICISSLSWYVCVLSKDLGRFPLMLRYRETVM
jgi:hypothetical protein